MLRLLRRRCGQNTAEYAILIGLVIAAAVAMQVYIKRGLQAKVKSGTDLMTSVSGSIDNYTLGTQEQYEPYYLSSDFVTSSDASKTEAALMGGGVNRTNIAETTNRTGVQTATNGTW